jgi:hypothetical protein
LEEDYRHGEPVDFSRSKLTIEHVLPQSPTAEWLDMLAFDTGEDETVEELHGSLVHTLGNLSLTAYNAKLANDGFAAKKKILSDSGLTMNREIAEASKWGARWRSAIVVEHWPIGLSRSGQVRTGRPQSHHPVRAGR